MGKESQLPPRAVLEENVVRPVAIEGPAGQPADIAGSADPSEIRGSAMRAATGRIEDRLNEAQAAREDAIFQQAYTDAYLESLREQGGVIGQGASEAEIGHRERAAAQAAGKAAKNAVHAQRLWEKTYADKIQELNAAGLADTSDPNDLFNAAAVDAANEAVAKFKAKNSNRADRMIPDLHKFGEGAAAGRTDARAQAIKVEAEPEGEARLNEEKDTDNSSADKMENQQEAAPQPNLNTSDALPVVPSSIPENNQLPDARVLDRMPAEVRNRFNASIDRIAHIRNALESSAGRRHRESYSAELVRAQMELRGILDQFAQTEKLDAAKYVEASLGALELIADRQVGMIPPEVSTRADKLRRALGAVGRITNHPVLKFLVPATIASGAVGLGLLTGGLAAGAGAAIVVGAVKGGSIGAGVGGALGGLGGAAQARAARRERSTASATRSRVDEQMKKIREALNNATDHNTFVNIADAGVYNTSVAENIRNTKERRKMVTRKAAGSALRGMITGAAVGGAFGFAGHGLEHAGEPKIVHASGSENVSIGGAENINPNIGATIAGYMDAHTEAISQLPANVQEQLANKIVQSASMPGDVIQRMIEETLKKANTA